MASAALDAFAAREQPALVASVERQLKARAQSNAAARRRALARRALAQARAR
jgi:hypothetical protein